MSERPATRADLRVVAWRWIYEPRGRDTTDALRLLAALDADEAGDARGESYVALLLNNSVVVDADDGCLHLRRRDAEAVR